MRRQTWRAAALTLALTGLLAGCGRWSQPGPIADGATSAQRAAWQERQASLGKLDRWVLQGRVASGGVFGVKGRLRWAQTGERFQVDVRGPFGIGATRITGTPDRVLIESDGQQWVTDEPEALMAQQFGWTVPLAGLRYWALGLPQPRLQSMAGAQLQLDDVGRATVIRQGRWTIEVEAYEREALDALPTRLRVTDGADAHLKLVVDSWQLGGR